MSAVGCPAEDEVSHYLFNFSKKGAAKGRSLREQAAELLDAKLWGIGAKTPNRNSLAAGDRVLIYVGAPEYEFVGDAQLASATHPWSREGATAIRATSNRAWLSAKPRRGRIPCR